MLLPGRLWSMSTMLAVISLLILSPATAWLTSPDCIRKPSIALIRSVAHLPHSMVSSVVSLTAFKDGNGNNQRKMVQRSYEKKEAFQADPVRGWSNMALYWGIASLVGVWGKYLSWSTTLFGSLPVPAFLVALVVTLSCQWGLQGRYGNFGRPVEWPAILSFATLNGILETPVSYTHLTLPTKA